jgi:hypothetical protein
LNFAHLARIRTCMRISNIATDELIQIYRK